MSAYSFRFNMEELLPIVTQLTERFTGYESTSVTYEKAEQLMGAVLYSIHELEQSECPGLIDREITAQEAYAQGCSLLRAKIGQTLEQYNQQIIHFDAYGSLCMRDLIYQGIPEFFKWYDPIYDPQNTILTLDYPHEELIENLCSIVLANLMGHILLRKPLQDCCFNVQDYTKLKGLPCEYNKIFPLLKTAAETFFCEYFSGNQEILQYFLPESSNLTVRLEQAMKYGYLESIFPGRANMR